MTLNGGEGDDSIEKFLGNSSTIIGGNGNDTIINGLNNDTGHDVLINGGAGNDYISLSGYATNNLI